MTTWRRRMQAAPPYAVCAALALVVGAMAAIMFASHRDGHWWGDDWALYLRQAQGLLDGDPGRVIDQNRFTVEASQGPAFSPPLYPWGFPIILAPFVAVVGDDIDRLALVPVLCAVVFAVSWFALARPRLGTLPALVGVGAVTLSPLLLGWSELIQSEWPFLAVTGGVLVGLDRVARSGALIAPTGRWLALVLLGVGAASAFSVRREGLAMVAAIAAAQVAAVIDDGERTWLRGPRDRIRLLVRLLVPHLAALAVVVLLQAMLPSTLVPRYDGTSVANVWRLAGDHIDHLAEVSGLKRPWDADPMVLGSDLLGWVAVVAYLGAALAGIGFAITRSRVRDLHLVAYAIAAFVIGGSFRVAINRYVCTVAPILLLLGLVALRGGVRRFARPGVATGVVVIVLAAIVVGNLANANVRIDRATAFAETGQVEWGPTHPAAIEMFEAVRALTDADAIVGAPKARAMTWETGRLAVQVDDFRAIPGQVELALLVVERDSDLAADLVTDDRFDLVWSNSRFALYEPR